MSTDLFKVNDNFKLFVYQPYKQDLASNNPWRLMCQKTQPTSCSMSIIAFPAFTTIYQLSWINICFTARNLKKNQDKEISQVIFCQPLLSG